MEAIADNIEEIEEEFLVLRDLCLHPNIPSFYGLYLKKHASKREEDQLWFVMEVIKKLHCIFMSSEKRSKRIDSNSSAVEVQSLI